MSQVGQAVFPPPPKPPKTEAPALRAQDGQAGDKPGEDKKEID
jgi:hypothetical protein